MYSLLELDTIYCFFLFLQLRSTTPPPGWGNWRLTTHSAPDPWVTCLKTVMELTQQVKGQQATVDIKSGALKVVNEALNNAFEAFSTEV